MLKMSHFHIPTNYRKPSMEVEEGCCKSYVITLYKLCYYIVKAMLLHCKSYAL